MFAVKTARSFYITELTRSRSIIDFINQNNVATNGGTRESQLFGVARLLLEKNLAGLASTSRTLYRSRFFSETKGREGRRARLRFLSLNGSIKSEVYRRLNIEVGLAAAALLRSAAREPHARSIHR